MTSSFLPNKTSRGICYILGIETTNVEPTTPPLRSYGEAFADVYDEWYAEVDDLEAMLELLCERNPRRVLELGVGTGRIAIPLARRIHPDGGQVVGLDESPEMLALLHHKDVDRLVTTAIGDMAREQPDGVFDLVVLSYNTLFNLGDQNLQRECIAQSAARLSAGGRLVIDACVIDPDAPAVGTTTERRGRWSLTTTSTFDSRTGDVVGTITSVHDDGRIVERPFRITYRSPEAIEHDCSSVGLRLTTRYESWRRTPFTDASSRHVSVFENLR